MSLYFCSMSTIIKEAAVKICVERLLEVLNILSLLALQHFVPWEMGLFSRFTGRAAACRVAIVLCHFTGDSHHYTRACWR